MRLKVFFALVSLVPIMVVSCSQEIIHFVQPGNIPIAFTSILNGGYTKVTATSFEEGDVVALYATLASESFEGQRYIDNLCLTCSDGTHFMPERTVFYPEGDATLDFVCYHPYQEEGVGTGRNVLSVGVQTDQRTKENLSKSDFLLAKKQNVASSEEAVELAFQHKFARLQITLVPGEDEVAADILKDNPQPVVAGVYTQADYNLTDESLSNLKEVADIHPYGVWSNNGGKLTGKEVIVLPQQLGGTGQSILLEWNGRIYTCGMPVLDVKAGMQCEISIEVSQNKSQVLTGIAGTVTDWTDMEGGVTDNKADNMVIHTATLSFGTSDVYRVYHEDKPVMDICREYLKSEALSSRAIVAYPLTDGTELPDLTKGTVLELLDTEEPIAGGTIRWNVTDNVFAYEKGNKKVVDKFYVKADGMPDLVSSEGAIDCDVVALTISDMRDGREQIYPIVKVGTQYWMKEDLRATSYRDGTPLEQKEDLGLGAGYFNPDGLEYYFYNGEAVLAGELSPEGWTIPTEKDWEKLKNYVDNDAGLLKTGEWFLSTGETGEVQPANDLTGFSVHPNGTWLNGAHNNYRKLNGFWSMEAGGKGIAAKIVFFTGGSGEFYPSDPLVKEETYYKALSVRCVKK